MCAILQKNLPRNQSWMTLPQMGRKNQNHFWSGRLKQCSLPKLIGKPKANLTAGMLMQRMPRARKISQVQWQRILQLKKRHWLKHSMSLSEACLNSLIINPRRWPNWSSKLLSHNQKSWKRPNQWMKLSMTSKLCQMSQSAVKRRRKLCQRLLKWSITQYGKLRLILIKPVRMTKKSLRSSLDEGAHLPSHHSNRSINLRWVAAYPLTSRNLFRLRLTISIRSLFRDKWCSKPVTTRIARSQSLDSPEKHHQTPTQTPKTTIPSHSLTLLNLEASPTSQWDIRR